MGKIVDILIESTLNHREMQEDRKKICVGCVACPPAEFNSELEMTFIPISSLWVSLFAALQSSAVILIVLDISTLYNFSIKMRAQ